MFQRWPLLLRDHRVTTTAFLRPTKPAKGTQSLLLGSFLALCWFFMAKGYKWLSRTERITGVLMPK